MSDLTRVSFTIERRLAAHLDGLMAEDGCSNRSEFIRDMIRDRVVAREWKRNERVVGTITIVYDHHVRGLNERLTRLQHRFHGSILASTHVHLDEHVCVEAILVKGEADRIREVVGLLRRQKGVLKSSLSLASLAQTLR